MGKPSPLLALPVGDCRLGRRAQPWCPSKWPSQRGVTPETSRLLGSVIPQAPVRNLAPCHGVINCRQCCLCVLKTWNPLKHAKDLLMSKITGKQKMSPTGIPTPPIHPPLAVRTRCHFPRHTETKALKKKVKSVGLVICGFFKWSHFYIFSLLFNSAPHPGSRFLPRHSPVLGWGRGLELLWHLAWKNVPGSCYIKWPNRFIEWQVLATNRWRT